MKEQELLIPCNSPCNTPILGMKKSNDKWRLVEDLQIVNETVVPFPPMVPNPYTLLPEIPEQAKYFPVIDLKDAFYSIPLAEESHFLFAFEDPTQPASFNLDSFAPGALWHLSLKWTELDRGYTKL